jgi:hypothetical protein
MAFIIVAVVLVNIAPDNPYQLPPPYILTAQPTHLLNIAHIAQRLSQVWPMLTALFLIFAWRDSRAEPRRHG